MTYQKNIQSSYTPQRCFQNYQQFPKINHSPLFDLTSSGLWRSGFEANIERGCCAGRLPDRPNKLAAVLGGAPANPGWGIMGIGGAACVGNC